MRAMFFLGVLFSMGCASAVVDPPPDDTPAPLGPQPEFGAVEHAPLPPPPISGGTLAAAPAADGDIVVASDPDRDQVHVVDLKEGVVVRTITFAPGSEPGRVVVDDAHRAHVVLRGSNEVASFALTAPRRAAAGTQTVRWPVCTAPRGIAYLPQRVVVACADGTVEFRRADTGEIVERQHLGRDLRDVVVASDDTMYVTRFRRADVMKIHWPLYTGPTENQDMAPFGSVAWRAVTAPARPVDHLVKSVAVVEQEAAIDVEATEIRTVAGAYGTTQTFEAKVDLTPTVKSACEEHMGIVRTRVEILGEGAVRIPEAVLPVDLALNDSEIAVVAAGNAFQPSLAQVYTLRRSDLASSNRKCVSILGHFVTGQAIAAVFTASDDLVVQTREPSTVHVLSTARTITLPGPSVADTGHMIFHANAGNFIACASCHPEGLDDGRTWKFEGKGARRTPSLRGTLRGTAPFHWDGDMRDLRQLVDDVFTGRMSGPSVDDAHFDGLSDWLFSLPPPTRLGVESEASARGAKLFADRCSSCHEGPRFTNSRTVDVGTGQPLQVPSLVGVAWRPPYLHDGCAKTLFDRFEPRCGSATHGDGKALGEGEIADIVAFLDLL